MRTEGDKGDPLVSPDPAAPSLFQWAQMAVGPVNGEGSGPGQGPGLWAALSVLDYCPVWVPPAKSHTRGMSSGRSKGPKLSKPVMSPHEKHWACSKEGPWLLFEAGISGLQLEKNVSGDGPGLSCCSE